MSVIFFLHQTKVESCHDRKLSRGHSQGQTRRRVDAFFIGFVGLWLDFEMGTHAEFSCRKRFRDGAAVRFLRLTRVA